MEVVVAILAFLLGLAVAAVIYLMRFAQRHSLSKDLDTTESNPGASDLQATTEDSSIPRPPRETGGVGSRDTASQPNRPGGAPFVSPRNRSAAKRMSQETLYDVERPYATAATVDKVVGLLGREVDESLTFLEEVEPVAEMWGSPHPWYQRADWEDPAKLRHDLADYEWAFYAPVQREAYEGNIERDHLVSLSEAHASGGCTWTASRKREFASDVTNMFLMPAAVNHQKHHHDPTEWRPANVGMWRKYAVEWIRVKRKWNLNFDAIELDFLRWMLDTPAE